MQVSIFSGFPGFARRRTAIRSLSLSGYAFRVSRPISGPSLLVSKPTAGEKPIHGTRRQIKYWISFWILIIKNSIILILSLRIHPLDPLKHSMPVFHIRKLMEFLGICCHFHLPLKNFLLYYIRGNLMSSGKEPDSLRKGSSWHMWTRAG